MKSATIQLIDASIQQTITIEEVKNLFKIYQEKNRKTGEQLSWTYDRYTFPYDTQDQINEGKPWIYLHGKEDGYHIIAIGVETNAGQSKIRIVLSAQSTHGDRNKAVEYCKMLGEQLKGEVHLFNDRVMYFYPRK